MSRNVVISQTVHGHLVTSREGRVSRNRDDYFLCCDFFLVTSREGRVSRNTKYSLKHSSTIPVNIVTSREGRVSRNTYALFPYALSDCHVPRGTCE